MASIFMLKSINSLKIADGCENVLEEGKKMGRISLSLLPSAATLNKKERAATSLFLQVFQL
jgi:hypothetical protein